MRQVAGMITNGLGALFWCCRPFDAGECSGRFVCQDGLRGCRATSRCEACTSKSAVSNAHYRQMEIRQGKDNLERTLTSHPPTPPFFAFTALNSLGSTLPQTKLVPGLPGSDEAQSNRWNRVSPLCRASPSQSEMCDWWYCDSWQDDLHDVNH